MLGVAFLLQATSFVQATPAPGRGPQLDRDLRRHVVLSADPTARAVFAEDAAALVGTVLAAIGVALHQVTGSVVPGALASIAIGLVLVAVALFLGERNRDFLVGEEVSANARARIASYVAAYPGIVDVRDLIVTFTGPDEVWVVARVDVDEGSAGRGWRRWWWTSSAR